MAKVTIAIPTYNRPEFLTQSIRSILGQTFQDFLILIFDDGSSFSYEDFLKKFNDNRIQVIKNQYNSGSNEKNFQKIFKHSYDTEYLVVFHDDDVMHPEMLERELKILEEDKAVLLAGTNLNFIHDFSKMNKFGQVGTNGSFKILNAVGAVRELLKGFDLSFASVMYRTNSLEDIEPYQKEFSKWADRPFVLGLIKEGKAGLLCDKLVNYRIHPDQDSQSGNNLNNIIEISQKLFRLYLSYLPKPLSQVDEKLFYSFTSNNIWRFSLGATGSYAEFRKVISKYKQSGLFRLKSLSARGLYYLFKRAIS